MKEAKEFCTCTDYKCPCHPTNHEEAQIDHGFVYSLHKVIITEEQDYDERKT